MFERLNPAETVLCAPSARDALEDVLASGPGPWAAAVLDELEGLEMDSHARDLYLQAWDRQAAWTEGRRLRAMAAVAGPAPTNGDDWAREEVALTLGVSPASADRQIAVARALDGHLWQTRSALELGEITWRQAYDMVELTAELDLDAAVEVEDVAFARCLGRPAAHWRRIIRREALKACGRCAAERRVRARADRFVSIWPETDGMARLDARLPADEAQAIWQALTAEADRLGHDDPRTFDQRRADVLASWAHSVLDDPSLPRRHGRSPRLQVTVGLATLLGLRDNPGELAGHGPIDAWLARELAADAEWELFITDPGTGALVAKGSRRYRPSQALRDFLLGREPECSFPGCPIPSERCDIDHAVPYDEGGDTDERNCGPPCRRHHRAKTFGGFVLERHPDGSVTWITPSGVARTEPPVRLAGDD